MRRILVVVLLAAAACSSNETPALQGPPSTIGTPIPGVATFRAKDFKLSLDAGNDNSGYYFSPQMINASKGSTATITIHNVGTVKHNLTIEGAHVDADVDPGKSVTITAPLGDATSVPFYCKYHRSSGMTGTFSLS